MNQFITTVVTIAGGIILLYLLIFKILGLRVVDSDKVAVVEKWWSMPIPI